jgi:hypothetical protein
LEPGSRRWNAGISSTGPVASAVARGGGCRSLAALPCAGLVRGVRAAGSAVPQWDCRIAAGIGITGTASLVSFSMLRKNGRSSSLQKAIAAPAAPARAVRPIRCT